MNITIQMQLFFENEKKKLKRKVKFIFAAKRHSERAEVKFKYYNIWAGF